ncbi:hypothetical protein HNY73_020781 [Argiope bruennichi]|uniref:Uncharacterized protein n=1 Tax=Argiope bruennichi TaxID=94029 RepID=A0A8T0EBT7_ARGBR|nr:hypothetical protein HNY73_020781 [Argiope bruennichi]
MSRQEKWKINRPIESKISQSFQKLCIPENKHMNVDEMEHMGANESINMNENELIYIYNGKQDMLKENAGMPSWNNHQQAVQNEMASIYHQRLNTRQAVYEPKVEKFSVWSAYKPILDQEVPMEVDEIASPNCQKEKTECNIFEGKRKTEAMQEDWNNHCQLVQNWESMDIDQNEIDWLQHSTRYIGKSLYEIEPEDFSVWKTYKPILDIEEPMEIDGVETAFPNTGLDVLESQNGSNYFWKSSKFDLEKGEPINTDNTRRVRDQNQNLNINQNIPDSKRGNINLWESSISDLESTEPMDVDKSEMGCSSFEKSNKQPNVRKYDNRKDYLNVEDECEFGIFESDKTSRDLNSPEYFLDYDFGNELLEDSDDVQEEGISDVEFEQWLTEYIKQLQENQEFQN